MHIPIGYRATATAKVRETFSCPRCKHWQRAEVTTLGLGAASLLWGGDLARERARASAGTSKNAERVLRFATCPKCGKRSGLGAFLGRQLVFLIIVAAIGFGLGYIAPVFKHMDGDDERALYHLWGPLILIGISMLSTAPLAIAEWRGIDRRVRWLDFERKAS